MDKVMAQPKELYIVKEIPESINKGIVMPILPTHFELFTSKVIKDINDNDVEIPISIGTYAIKELEKEKADLLIRIQEIDKKILTIKNLTEIK